MTTFTRGRFAVTDRLEIEDPTTENVLHAEPEDEDTGEVRLYVDGEHTVYLTRGQRVDLAAWLINSIKGPA